jgi:hypothetical protein
VNERWSIPLLLEKLHHRIKHPNETSYLSNKLDSLNSADRREFRIVRYRHPRYIASEKLCYIRSIHKRLDKYRSSWLIPGVDPRISVTPLLSWKLALKSLGYLLGNSP